MSRTNEVDPAELLGADEYGEPAELFITRRGRSRRGVVSYRRFDTVAEAIGYAVDECAGLGANDVIMTVEDKRFNLGALRAIHRSARISGGLPGDGPSPRVPPVRADEAPDRGDQADGGRAAA